MNLSSRIILIKSQVSEAQVDSAIATTEESTCSALFVKKREVWKWSAALNFIRQKLSPRCNAFSCQFARHSWQLNSIFMETMFELLSLLTNKSAH